jgi:predicted metalloprotease with PDZ domain
MKSYTPLSQYSLAVATRTMAQFAAYTKRILVCVLLTSAIHAHAQESIATQPNSIQLHVDLTDAPRHILHIREDIPVASGPLTLEYPEWIPGNHRPTGPIDNVAGVFVRADGRDLSWRRDLVDLYAIHVDVPSGVTRLNVYFDFLAVPGNTGASEDNSTSANLAVLEWNSAILYPAGIPVSQISIAASLTLPTGWNYGTALATIKHDGTEVTFFPVSLEQLVDSPVITGRYFREIPLAPQVTPRHYLDLAADAPEALEIKPAILQSISRLVLEAGALYASHHYNSYHFLLSLSDAIRKEGLEHHQSSDNGVEEHGFSNGDLFILNADLLPHEFTHSWNGKYRRPIGLATPDYRTPMQDDLLWVYEGMTNYWGFVLATRSGLMTPQQYRDALAYNAASLDIKPGRIWRNTQDTADASSLLRDTSQNWSSWRRGQDYYREGALIWLDADVTIRALTHDQKSLNDFCRSFLGLGGDTAPKVIPYTFDDVVAALNAVVPYDWRGFLTERLESHTDHTTLDGVEHGGYKLVYSDQPTAFQQAMTARLGGGYDAYFSAGFRINKDMIISDVLMGSPAFKAGLGPQMKLVAVNGHATTPEVIQTALRDAKTTSAPIELLISNSNELGVLKLDYHGGERYPHLEQVSSTPSFLDEIIQPLVK